MTVCQRCGCKQSVMVLVRTDPTGIRIRRRKCKHCGNRYYTAQPPEEVISKYQLQWTGSTKTHNEVVRFKGTCERICDLGDSSG